MRRGFTLMEMMIVLVILGILAGIALPQFNQAIERTKVKEAESVLKSIRGAEKVFKAEHNSYVGVDITSATKQNEWDLLEIEVLDTVDWSYGVETVNCCNSNGAWGENANNLAAIPFAQRLRGANKDKIMRITMTTGVLSGFVGTTACVNINCSDQK